MESGVPRMAFLGPRRLGGSLTLPLLAVLGAAMVGAAPDAELVGPPAVVESSTSHAPDAAAAPSVPDDPWSSPEIAAPRMEGRPLPRKRDAGRGTPPTDATASRGSPWLRTTGSLAAVVGLIVLLAWGYRLVAGRGRLALSGRRTGLIEIVGRTTLSPRQSLCLVRLGPRLVLLGLTHDAVRALDVIQDADLTARLAGQAAQRRPDSQTAEFARCLEREAQTYTPALRSDGDRPLHADETVPVPVVDETVTPEEARLVDVRERLTRTVERLRAKLAQA